MKENAPGKQNNKIFDCCVWLFMYSLFAEACNCFKSEAELYPETMEAGDIKFGKNSKGEIVYVAVAQYEAHGVDSGTRKLQRRMIYWVTLFLCTACGSLAGVISTWHLLNDADFAFIPAVFCLCIGLSCTGAGFSYLRSQAAKEIRHWVEEHNLSEETLAKCIYPKTKGQRGGAALDEKTVDIIDAMIPRNTADPNQLRSLRDVSHLVQPSLDRDESDTDMYG